MVKYGLRTRNVGSHVQKYVPRYKHSLQSHKKGLEVKGEASRYERSSTATHWFQTQKQIDVREQIVFNS